MSYTNWTSSPPPDCPFPLSSDIRGLAFSGRYRNYTSADTWYPSWASDGKLYSPWTDGYFADSLPDGFDVQAMDCSSDSRNAVNANRNGKSGTGNACISGDDPLNLTVEDLGVHYAMAQPYGGRYPCGSLVHSGVWYYGTYALDETDRGLNWDVLGPFIGFRISHDYGKTWEDCPHTPQKPIFSESGKAGRKVKIGAPHFVDFGQNLQHSPDGKAYLVGHGATRLDAEVAWIRGDQAFLVRVTPSPKTMNDPSQYEFFAGHDESGRPIWTYDLGQIRPLIEWQGRVGHTTMTYVAPLKKYLLYCTDGGTTISAFNTFLLESDQITGPWRLVTFMEKFGEQAYFVNMPSKFISNDGRTAWLSYSANFSNLGLIYGTQWKPNPEGSKYAMSLHEIVLDISK